MSTPGLTHLAHHEQRGIDAMVAIGVLADYTGTIVHDGLSSYDRPELAGATHAQSGVHLLRHLDRVARVDSQRGWATAMRWVLLNAKDAAESARRREIRTSGTE